jgi:hypothetical protein
MDKEDIAIPDPNDFNIDTYLENEYRLKEEKAFHCIMRENEETYESKKDDLDAEYPIYGNPPNLEKLNGRSLNFA